MHLSKKSYRFTLILLLTGMSLFFVACKHDSTLNDSDNQSRKQINILYDVALQKTITLDELHARLDKADFILLGETHDNPGHHLRQADVIDYLVRQGKRPAVVFEMLDEHQQPAIDQFLQQANRQPDDFAKAVQWEQSGWPDWDIYRPVFAASLKHNLPITAGNMSREDVRKNMKTDNTALDPYYAESLARYVFADDLRQELYKELNQSHCNALPDTYFPSMLKAQQLRDITLSRNLLKHAESGAVLITGSGHARKDVGVPWYLRGETGEQLTLLSLAFIETEASDKPDSLHELPDFMQGYDIVWLTEDTPRDDPCESFKNRK